MDAARRDRRFTGWFILLVLLIVFASDNGRIDGDGLVRWETQVILHETGTLSSARYSIIHNLFAAPLYWTGQAITAALGIEGEAREDVLIECVQRFNKFVLLGILAWIFVILRRGTGNLHLAAWGVFIALFASLLIPHAISFYSECLWTLLLLIALGCLNPDPENSRPILRYVVAQFAIMFMIPLNPLLAVVGAAAVGLIFLGACYRKGWLTAIRQPEYWVAGFGLLFGVGLCLIENKIRRGAVGNFGYASEGFTGNLIHGLWGQSVAPARGFLWFMPAFLLGIPLWFSDRLRPQASLHRLVGLSFLIGLLILCAYAKWHAWHGAWYWGPRFLLPLSVFGALYLALWLQYFPGCKKLAYALIASTYLVYKCGVVIGQSHLIECLRLNPTNESCYWNWRFSPFASWLNPGDLGDMLTHHSMAVELIGIALLLVLIRQYRTAH